MLDRFHTFTVLITKINYQIRKLKTEEMEKFNLKGTHVSCLYYLFKMNTLTAAELCDICHEDKAAISRSIEYLEKEDYLCCESKTQKRYKSLLHLTQKGNEIANAIASKVDAIVEKASAGLSEQDREVMYRALNSICQNLESITQ